MNILCPKCKKSMDDDNFYTHKDGQKAELCKKCLTMHIDNFDPSTFLWILEEMDVPYIEEEWNVLRDRAYAKDPFKMNGMSVFGKYLSKMKLKQWKDYGWEDTERFKQESEARKKKLAEEKASYEEELKQQYESGKISKAQYMTLMSTEVQHKERGVGISNPPPSMKMDYNPFLENTPAFIQEEELTDPSAELTQEDKVYLAMKWGRQYRPDEWIALEKNYNEMMASFDIQDADTINTLILLCKTNLKMNQAIDNGDVDGFQKLSRVSESLRKSAKFTAAQNKESKNDFVDSVGELVALCEREGFIPRYATDIPQDKVDATLKDMNNYVRKLVTQDLGFGQQIEDSLKKIQLQKEMNEAESQNYDDDDEVAGLVDEDYEAYYEHIAEEKEKDMQVMMGEEI